MINLIYLIIFLEGYVVLSSEILAIRLTIPFVGSGTDTISIVIAGVLLPLAFGYYRGGSLKFSNKEEIEYKLAFNFVVSLLFLSLGLSYAFLNITFEYFIETLELTNRLLLSTLYTCGFLVAPVYLLGQTIPLVSNNFKNTEIAKTTANILFYSTLGSFAGAIGASIFLMNTIGVPFTASVTLMCLLALILLVKPKRIFLKPISILIFLIALIINSPIVLKNYDLIYSNAYSFVQVKEHNKKDITLRYFKINGAYSSAFRPDKDSDQLTMTYAKFIDERFLRPIKRLGTDGKVLILGAGGFTLGLDNAISQITYVDIDPDLKEAAQEHFIKKKLGRNKKFIATPVRNFLLSNKDRYDLIILDIGKGLTGSPEHLVTQEFFAQLKEHIADDGILLAHYYISPLMENVFSRNLHATISSVFPFISRNIMDGFNPWNDDYVRKSSVVYVYRHTDHTRAHVYTDLLNQSTLEKSGDLVF